MSLTLATVYLVCLAVMIAIAVSEPSDQWLYKVARSVGSLTALALAITTVVA